MATNKFYFDHLLEFAVDIGKYLGSDILSASKGLRVAVFSVLACIAVLVKALVDNGVITDAQLNAALIEARTEIWPEEQSNP